MAEALVAVGAASSIIQIIDFCSKVAIQAAELANSSHDALRENDELERLTLEYNNLSLNPGAEPASNQGTQAERLSAECKREARRVLDLLDDLKIASGCRGARRIWQSTKQSARFMHKKKDIKKKRKRLRELNSQLATAVLLEIREYSSQSGTTASTILQAIHESREQAIDAVLKSRQALEQEFATSLGNASINPPGNPRQVRAIPENYNGDLYSSSGEVEASEDSDLILDDDDGEFSGIVRDAQVIQDLEATKAARVDQEKEAEKRRELNEQFHRDKERDILDSIMGKLAYPAMLERQDSVSTAYYDTYTWAVENNFSGLKSWLSEQDGTYWISGKAGSGKSTLIKFLAGDVRTHQLLHQWRTGNVHIIQCFFWYAGNPMQRSIEGLVRTILYQILQACPQLAKTLFPQSYTSVTRDDPSNLAFSPSVFSRPVQEYSGARLPMQHSDPSTNRISRRQHRKNPQPPLRALHQARQASASQPHPGQRSHSSPQSEHLEHLKEAIKRMGHVGRQDADLLNGNHNFCIFIDGLDEYAGDQPELIQLLNELSMSPVVKLCLASRPWNVFRRAYEHRCSHLLLEDLTRGDIDIYVRGKLDWITHIPELLPEDFDADEFESLVVEIVNGAEGVFLWIYLVVLSVTRGLAEGDSTPTLRRRVASFPNDLYEFFNAILGRVDGVYQPLTTQLLTLACMYVDDPAAAESSWFIDYWLLTTQPTTLWEPRSVYKMQPRLCSPKELISMAKETQLKISAACKDLIYIKQSAIEKLAQADADAALPKVELLHRTVYDFLRSDGRREMLNDSLPACFRDNTVTHFINLARLKIGAAFGSDSRFHQMVAYSLSSHWSQLDLEFVGQVDHAETVLVRHGPKNPLIAAALLAFQDHRRFTEKYLVQGDGATDSFKERFADCGISHMLNAALGFSPIRSFDLDQINFAILEPVMALVYMFGDEIDASGLRAATWQHFFSRSATWMLTREPAVHGGKTLRESSAVGQKICTVLLRLMTGAGAMWPSDNLQLSSSGRCEDGEQCFRHAWMNFKQRLPKALVAHCEIKIRSAMEAPYAYCSRAVLQY